LGVPQPENVEKLKILCQFAMSLTDKTEMFVAKNTKSFGATFQISQSPKTQNDSPSLDPTANGDKSPWQPLPNSASHS